MAKKKKKTTTRRRRRGMGAVALNPTSPMVQIGSAVLGFLVSKPVNGIIDKVTGTLDPKIVAGAQVGLGAAYIFTKGKKNLLLVVGSGVLAGAGLKRAMTAFGIGRIGGYGMTPVLNGYGQVPAIGQGRTNGYKVPGIVNGYIAPGTINNVMGSTRGSGLTNDGSDLMG